jgi:hypothetical protein
MIERFKKQAVCANVKKYAQGLLDVIRRNEEEIAK